MPASDALPGQKTAPLVEAPFRGYPTKPDKLFGDREPKTQSGRVVIEYEFLNGLVLQEKVFERPETRGRTHFIDLEILIPLVFSNAVARIEPPNPELVYHIPGIIS
ncbi:hypothetical protein BDM02DRAFT_3132385 [Thelephora ganbajun]|uniref:Uncharacterized protein n=1 Tax=Thelephora ganbajun TaxID=370292 RepID=A0ACB6Z228_THEGA|nr:hypothetical protein BDM02DRAFT_3132385 [Thelephora ganbajun]